jgi:Mrp family chromosome partitioning ATPase
MTQLTHLLRERYALIIVDTPPVLLATDALTVGIRSDGMLFLLRARKTQREQIQEARQRIARLDIRLLGYVINNVKTFLPRIWSRYYYGNY